MLRRLRTNGPLILAIAFAFGASMLFVVWPLLLPGAPPSVPHGHLEIIRERGITWVAGLWFFAFGASIGSFLNVVAYRMPMGLTIVTKPSRCPYCETPIRFKHNVPIFGWIALRGRCASCRLPISARYLLVELVVGLLFFLLFWRELASGGANLPLDSKFSRSGVMWNLLSPNWQLIGCYFYHALLIGLLATIALIKFDRLKIPLRLVTFSVVTPIMCVVLWPTLMVLPWWSPALSPLEQPWPWESLTHSLAGLVVGLLVGWAAHETVENRRLLAGTEPARVLARQGSNSGLFVTHMLVGAFLGWQCVVPFLVFTSVFQFFLTLGARFFDRSAERLWGCSSLLSAMLVICLWKQLPLIGLPGKDSGPLTHWLWLLFGLGALFLAKHLTLRRES